MRFLIACSVLLISTFSMICEAQVNELHEAAKNGDLSSVRQYLAENPELINSRLEDGMSLLHTAVYNNKIEIVRYMLENNVNLDVKSKSGSTPLHGAAYYGFYDIAKLLLENGIDPDVRNNGGYTPVLSAIAGGQSEIVELLVKSGVDVNQSDDNGRSLLHRAVMASKNEIVNLLLELGADLNIKTELGETPLWWAMRLGNYDLAKILIEKGSLPESILSDGTTMLHHATACDNSEMVKLIIKNGVDVNVLNQNKITPLHLAAIYGFVDVANILMENGADKTIRSADGAMPFHYAFEGGNDSLAFLIAPSNYENIPREFPEIRGKYLGQTVPGEKAELFAEKIILNPVRPHGGITVSPDGKEIFWTRNAFNKNQYERIWCMNEINGIWSPPHIAPFAVEYNCSHPSFSPDGQRIYFNSNRPLEKNDHKSDEDIWYVKRELDGWSEAINPGKPLNSPDDDFLPSPSANDNLYFIRISSDEENGRVIDIETSSWDNDHFTEPVNPGEPLNSPYVEARPLIAPDESYLLFTSNRPGGAKPDLETYISFNDKDGWPNPVTLNNNMIMQGITADGKFWIYNETINGSTKCFWISSGIANQYSN